jgi:hypothetical protein
LLTDCNKSVAQNELSVFFVLHGLRHFPRSSQINKLTACQIAVESSHF